MQAGPHSLLGQTPCPQCWGYECLRSLKPEPSAPEPVGKAFEAFCPWGKEGGKPASWARPCQLRGCWPPRSVLLPRPLPSRSYVFSSLATSAVSFATGALGMWIPLYLHRAQVVQKAVETCSSPPCAAKDRCGQAGSVGRWGWRRGEGGRRPLYPSPAL